MLFYGASDFFPWIICWNFMLFLWFHKMFSCVIASRFIALKCYHDIGMYIGMKIHGSVLLKWFTVWLHCKKDMELSQMILRELIGGKFLCDATGIIIWYIVYVGPWVLGWKSLKPLGKTLCGCIRLVLPLGFSP